MKVACLMYGMLRNFSNTYETFNHYILQQLKAKGLDVKVYFAGYANKTGKDNCEKILVDKYKCINPKFMDWNEKQKSLIANKTGPFSDFSFVPGARVESIFSSWYCKKEVFHIMEQNEIPDYVILVRPDVYWFRSINLDCIEKSMREEKIMIPEEWDFKCVHPVAVSDAFAMGSYKTVKSFVSCIENIQSYKNLINMHAETLCGLHISVAGLNRGVCPRHFAFETPFSSDDVFSLWEKDWTKEDFKEDEDRKKYG